MRFSLPSSLPRPIFGIAFFDIFWLVMSPFLALWLRGDNLLDLSNISIISSPTYEYVLLTVVCGLPSFLFFRINNGLVHLCTSKDIYSVFSAVSVSVLVSSYVVFSLSRLDGIPRSIPLLYGLILFLGLVGYRVVIRGLYEKKFIYYLKPSDVINSISLRKIIIFGLNQFSISAIRLIDTQYPRTTLVVAVISPDGRYTGKTLSGVKIIGRPLDFGVIIDEYDIHGVKIDEVWVSVNNNAHADYLSLLEVPCRERNIVFKSIEDALNLKPRLIADYDAENVFRNNQANITQQPYLRIKRLLDVFISIILCGLLLPLFILICSITLYEIGTPILFWQERVGLYGRKFLLYKVRTLGLPFDINRQLVDDKERVSKHGVLIRRLRLDEIPQLLSIIIGDMSGIGPRPLLPRDQPNDTRERLLLRPGITGWAQVNGGDLLCPEEKNALDCWYVHHVSFKLDVKIVFKSISILIYGVSRNDIAIQKALDWYKKRDNSFCS